MKLFICTLLMFVSHLALAGFDVEILADKLEHPWGLALLPGGRFLVTERVGNLRLVDGEGNVSAPITGLPDIVAEGQGGLLDVVIHPDFHKNKLVYLSMVVGDHSDGSGYGTEVIRGVLEESPSGRFQLSNIESIFVALPKSESIEHFGSRLVLDKSGYLYISLGERGQRREAQKITNHLGSIIRLHEDGRIPTDNPFVNTKGAKPEIYSYGHRNIQGLALHPETGKLWAHEHGPQGGDELNIIEAGKNYGWPVISYGAEYGSGIKVGEGTHKQGMEQPLYFWDPSIAPSGLAFFQGDVWIGALSYQLLTQLSLKDTLVVREQRHFANEFGRIRDVRSFDGNSLYLLTDSKDGKIIKLTDTKR
jgi:glucose/arabinose dehydrogenase